MHVDKHTTLAHAEWMVTPDLMYQHIGDLLDGHLAGDDAVTFLKEQEIADLSPPMLAAAVNAVMDRALPFPSFPEALDCCGTGGDGRSTYNISTTVAFVAAACGVSIAKHGNRAVSSQSGSADVLEALGARTALTTQKAETLLRDLNLVFLYAPTFHLGFARVAPIRKAVGKRTVFNLIGPLCNPVRPKRQLIGVFAPEYCAIMAETARILGMDRVMVVYGDDGTDEISITSTTHVAQLDKGVIQNTSLQPHDAGLTQQEGRALIGGDAHQNATALRDVLQGLACPYADAVLINSAAVLMLSGKASSLKEGMLLARNSIARGDALRLLDAYVAATQEA